MYTYIIIRLILKKKLTIIKYNDMRVILSFDESIQKITFTFKFDNNDHKYFYNDNGRQIFPDNKSCFFIMPDNYVLADLHPDRLALVILLLCLPFIKSQLVIPFAVSNQFSSLIKQLFSINIYSNEENNIKPIPHPENNSQLSSIPLVPGLCLSMGLDSVSALLLMPPETTCVFLDRHHNLGLKTTYRKDCVYNGLAYVKQLHNKNKVYVVNTNMEFLRKTPTFMLDISVTVPALLLSNHAFFKSINVGYSIHHFEQYYNKQKIQLYCTGDDEHFKYNIWSNIFNSVGLYLNFPTMGLSEIGTQKIVLKSPFRNISSGCMSGRIGKPCLNCKKCYRKELSKYHLTKGKLDANKAVFRRLTTFKWHKIQHLTKLHSLKMAFSYMLPKYTGRDPILIRAKRYLAPYKKYNKYVDNWFIGARSCIDDQILSYIYQMLPMYKIKIMK